jgi:hypothetical protein
MNQIIDFIEVHSVLKMKHAVDGHDYIMYSMMHYVKKLHKECSHSIRLFYKTSLGN